LTKELIGAIVAGCASVKTKAIEGFFRSARASGTSMVANWYPRLMPTPAKFMVAVPDCTHAINCVPAGIAKMFKIPTTAGQLALKLALAAKGNPVTVNAPVPVCEAT
jgi:hypothetical protein